MAQMVNKGLKGHHPSASLILAFKSKRDGGVEPAAFDAGKTNEEAIKEFQAYLNETALNLSKRPGATKQQNDNSPEDLPEPAPKDKDPPRESE